MESTTPQKVKNTFSALRKTLVILLVFSLGFIAGNFQTVIAAKLESKVSINTFWRVWNILDRQFVETSHKTDGAVDTKYDNLTKQDRRIYGAIKGMVDSEKDPYTTFFTPKEASEFETEIKGSFSGVGMEVGKKDGVLTVIAPIVDTPAYKAGIKTGDKILKIDDHSTNDMSVDAAIALIRGDQGTRVNLTMYREGVDKPLEFSLIRETIKLPTLDHSFDKTTGVYTIKLYSFSEQAANLFKDALDDFTKTKGKKLIIDLRGNPGGYLDAAVDMASWFIPAGKIIVTQDYGAKKPQDHMRSLGHGPIGSDIKIATLVDGGSASASEILAGALQDYGRATLVGQKTFGKGSVQEYLKITDDTGLKVTIARWLTPKGNSISVSGLTPDVEVKPTEEQIKNKEDVVLKKAVEILAK